MVHFWQKCVGLSRIWLICGCLALGASPHLAHAEKAIEDDAYDPFTDYSDFEESSEEEADINFFKNGRFLNIGIAGGGEMFTENLNKYVKNSSSLGFFISYFFDLRFALFFGVYNATHSMTIAGDGFETIKANVELARVAINFKYFLNTQNVTRGFAVLNPYIQTGFSFVTRGVSQEDNLSIGKDSATGFDIGAGIEFPILDNRLFLGLEGMYHAVNFADESTELKVGSTNSGIFLTGDVVSFNLNIGTNF